MSIGIRWRESKLSTLLIGNRKVHSVGCTLHLLNTDIKQELPLQLLFILLLPFLSIIHNLNSIKAAHRIQYCILPLMDLGNSLSHSHNSKSILLWIIRKKEVKWNSSFRLQWRMVVCDERNEMRLRGWGSRIELVMRGIWWIWNDNE